jgi:hypothetical protein
VPQPAGVCLTSTAFRVVFGASITSAAHTPVDNLSSSRGITGQSPQMEQADALIHNVGQSSAVLDLELDYSQSGLSAIRRCAGHPV